jgi:hypothetical protein
VTDSSEAERRFTPADDFRSRANSWCSRNCAGAASIFAGCNDCCLTLVVARSGPREADTIGIRPVLLPAWKWQWIRNMCHDREGPQVGDVRRQQKSARTAHYADRKGNEQFTTQSHLYPPYPPIWRNTHCDGPSIAGAGIWNQPCDRRDAFSD